MSKGKKKQDSAEETILSAPASPETPRREQNGAPGAPLVGSGSVSIESNINTKEVQDKIKSCLQLYMNKEEVVKSLFELDGIDPGVTSLAWDQLEEEEPQIFKHFNAKLILEEQSSELQDNLENYLAPLDDPSAPFVEEFQHRPVDTLRWEDTIPLDVPIPPGNPQTDSLSTVSHRQFVNDENPASGSFHPAPMNYERLMAMVNNAADIAPVPPFINLEIPNPESVTSNYQTDSEYDPILSCLNPPKKSRPSFGNLTDIKGYSISLDPPEPNFSPDFSIFLDTPEPIFNPGSGILPDPPEPNSNPDFGTLLDPPQPKIDVDEYPNLLSSDTQSEDES